MKPTEFHGDLIEAPQGPTVPIGTPAAAGHTPGPAAAGPDRAAQQQSLRALLAPRSLVVVGAGRQPGTVGHEVLRSVLDGGFTGRVLAVNPHADRILGVACSRSVHHLPGPVDLAVVAVPARQVARVLSDCAARGVRSVVVLSAGFSEAGETDRQAELVRICRSGGMRMVGPNCLGLVNTHEPVRLHATFGLQSPAPGRLSVASQSGAVGLALLDSASRSGVGVSTFVSLGNKADVSSNDLLAYWEHDQHTGAVAMYLESFGNPAKFAQLARQISRRKPVLVVKAGRSPGGRRAGASHTAAAASADAVVDSLFSQAGVIRTRDLDELMDAARMLVDQPLPHGNRLAVLGNAGGINILAADSAAPAGLTVPELSPQLVGALRHLDPDGAGLANPVDLGAEAGPDTVAAAVRHLATSGQLDALLVCVTALRTQDPDAVLAALGSALDAQRQLPAALVVTGLAQPPVTVGHRRVPVFSSAERAVQALGHAAGYGRWRAAPAGNLVGFVQARGAAARELVRVRAEAGSGWQPQPTVRALLADYGIRSIPATVVTDQDMAVRAADTLGYPVAVKAADPTLVHKSDVGAVRLGLGDADAVRGAFTAVRDAVRDHQAPVLVQAMAPGGVEIIAGLRHDPLFGPVLMVGLGGVSTDLLGDRALHLLPLTDRDARNMWRSLRSAPLLTGYRGAAPVDTGALEELLLRLAQLATDLPEIAELDLNPVVVSGRGAVTVDAKIRLSVPGGPAAGSASGGRGSATEAVDSAATG